MRRPPKPPPAPKIPSDVETRALTSVRSFDAIEECRVEGCELAKQVAEGLTFDAVRLEGGTVAESRFPKLRWTDVACARTDLSTVACDEAKLLRVEFRDCRMTGASFHDAELDSVRFVGCHLGYATFAGSKFRRVSFEACRLDESTFAGADLQGTMFDDCELRRIDLEGARLAAVDVSASRLSEVKIGAKDLRGLVVNREQASVLATLIGMVVRD